MLSRTWRPELYKELIDSRRIDLERFSSKFGFFPGPDSGVAKLVVPGLELEQPYSGIKKLRDGVWRFEGSSFQATLRTNSVLAVQYSDAAGAQRTLVFVDLPAEADDVIAQELERREALLETIRRLGPDFRSENYGRLSFDPANASGDAFSGGFSWSGYDLLRSVAIPPEASESGVAEMRLFLDASLSAAYSGAFSLRFEGAPRDRTVDFLYVLEPNGLRLEYLPPASLEGTLVKRRAASPIVISFARAER